MYFTKDFLIIHLIGTSLFLLPASTVLADNQSNYRFTVQSSQPNEIDTMNYIEIQLRAILATNPILNHYNIKSSVSNKKAYLTGKVRTENEKQLAENIAIHIPGVITVKNHLSIEKI